MKLHACGTCTVFTPFPSQATVRQLPQPQPHTSCQTAWCRQDAQVQPLVCASFSRSTQLRVSPHTHTPHTRVPLLERKEEKKGVGTVVECRSKGRMGGGASACAGRGWGSGPRRRLGNGPGTEISCSVIFCSTTEFRHGGKQRGKREVCLPSPLSSEGKRPSLSLSLCV